MEAYRLSVVDSASRKRRRTCCDTSDTTQGRPAMQANGTQVLKTPATTGGSVLPGDDALTPWKAGRAVARDTASIALKAPMERVTSSGYETNEF